MDKRWHPLQEVVYARADGCMAGGRGGGRRSVVLVVVGCSRISLCTSPRYGEALKKARGRRGMCTEVGTCWSVAWVTGCAKCDQAMASSCLPGGGDEPHFVGMKSYWTIRALETNVDLLVLNQFSKRNQFYKRDRVNALGHLRGYPHTLFPTIASSTSSLLLSLLYTVCASLTHHNEKLPVLTLTIT